MRDSKDEKDGAPAFKELFGWWKLPRCYLSMVRSEMESGSSVFGLIQMKDPVGTS